MWKKDTRERNSTMSQCCFLLHRASRWQLWEVTGAARHWSLPEALRSDPLCCTSKAFATGVVQFSCPSVQANGGYGKGGRVMAGCGFSSVVDAFQDFVTRFLEKEMTEVAGSMKERTVTKAGQFCDDHIWITTAWTWRHHANADDADDATGSSRGRWPKEKRNGLMARLNVEMSRKGWYLVLGRPWYLWSWGALR